MLLMQPTLLQLRGLMLLMLLMLMLLLLL